MACGMSPSQASQVASSRSVDSTRWVVSNYNYCSQTCIEFSFTSPITEKKAVVSQLCTYTYIAHHIMYFLQLDIKLTFKRQIFEQ